MGLGGTIDSSWVDENMFGIQFYRKNFTAFDYLQQRAALLP